MERWLTRLENDIMLMVPNTPHIEQWKCVVVGLRNTQVAREAGQRLNTGVLKEKPSARQNDREGAAEEEMVVIFYAGSADLSIVNQCFIE